VSPPRPSRGIGLEYSEARGDTQVDNRLGGYPPGLPPLTLKVPEELVERVAKRAAELVLVALERDAERWPEWLSVETAARYLDVSPERVRKLQARGDLPFYQEAPGCRVLFSRRELDDWLACFRRSSRA
jgi:excisionase family DNA binding protein